MKPKVLLITPPYHCGVVESAGTWLPLSLVYLAGSLRESGYEVEIYDAMSLFHTFEQISAKILDDSPDVVATTAFTATVCDAIEVLDLAKKINKETVTVLGGVHPTFCWEDILSEHNEIDYIVRGEGEITFCELLDSHFAKVDLGSVKGIAYRREGKIVTTAKRPFIDDLDSLPTAWDLIDWPIYTYRPNPGSRLAIVSFARGCTQACSFCSQQKFWEQSWRSRTPENFVSELTYLKETHGVDVVMIADESPATSEENWLKLLDLLIEADLGIEILMETRVVDVIRDQDLIDRYKKAGIVHIYVGVESGSQAMLDKFNKDVLVSESKKAIQIINDADIISETSFVLGMPDETKTSIRKTVELAKHYNPDLAFFLTIAPWPYADIYDELKPYIETYDYRKYNLVEPVIKPKQMTRDELSKELFNAFGNFYMHKMTQLPKMTAYKRNHMIAVGKLLSDHSYLSSSMKKLKAIMHKQLDEYKTRFFVS